MSHCRIEEHPGQRKASLVKTTRDFPGGPVVKTLSFQCRGHRFDPWSGNQESACHWPRLGWGWREKKKRKITECVLRLSQQIYKASWKPDSKIPFVKSREGLRGPTNLSSNLDSAT